MGLAGDGTDSGSGRALSLRGRGAFFGWTDDQVQNGIKVTRTIGVVMLVFYAIGRLSS